LHKLAFVNIYVLYYIKNFLKEKAEEDFLSSSAYCCTDESF